MYGRQYNSVRGVVSYVSGCDEEQAVKADTEKMVQKCLGVIAGESSGARFQL
jgi:hypothetical protein